jgi:hypothetical protein
VASTKAPVSTCSVVGMTAFAVHTVVAPSAIWITTSVARSSAGRTSAGVSRCWRRTRVTVKRR